MINIEWDKIFKYIEHIKEFKEKIENCEEHILYFLIDRMGYRLWRLAHDSSDGRIDFDMVEESKLQYKIILAVEQTKRFGVSEPFKDNLKTPTEHYWSWYKQWDKWKKGMSKETWDKFDELLLLKKDVSKFLPTIDRSYPNV